MYTVLSKENIDRHRLQNSSVVKDHFTSYLKQSLDMHEEIRVRDREKERSECTGYTERE